MGFLKRISGTIYQKPIYLILFILIISQSGCQKKKSESNEYDTFLASHGQWQEKRIEGLKKNWLSLRGLFWLQQGENSFGSHSSNHVIFPADRAPGEIGKFLLTNNRVTISVSEEMDVTHEGNPVSEMIMQSDELGKPTILEMGSLRWHVIKRGDKFGVRLRDSESPFIKEFHGLDAYKLDTAWRIKARYEPHIRPVTMTINDVLGTSTQYESPGAMVFSIDGETYKLNIMSKQDAKRYWMIFADETSGRETYGGGRYLYVDAPGETGFTYIDFNQAYNPPCAFTSFATCPLAPVQNILPIPITAGEKSDH